MFGRFKRPQAPTQAEPEITQAHKDAALADMTADMIDTVIDGYIRHSVFAWKDIEEFASRQQQNDAAVAVGAFKAGLVLMAASHMKAGSMAVDFEQNPEHASFALAVMRVIFAREHGEAGEEWLKGVMCEGQRSGTPAALAYKAGMREGEQAAESVMSETDVMNRDALRDVLHSIYSQKAEHEALRSATVERSRATIQ